jgi:hypothetical protein
MCVCVCVCVYVYILLVCTYVCMYLCMYACMYAHECVNVYIRTCVYIYIYTCMYVCAYICMYVYKMFYRVLIEQLSPSSHFTTSQCVWLRFILNLSLLHTLPFPVSYRSLQLKSSINILSECMLCVYPHGIFYIRLRHHVTENEYPSYAHLFTSLPKSIYLSMCQFCTAYFWFAHIFSFCSFRDKEQILRPTVD